MRHTIAHDLSPELAQKTARAACDHYTARFAKYEPNIVWRNERNADIAFRAKGLSLKARIEVAVQSLVVDIDIPFLLRPFEGRAKEIVEREMNKWIAKAKAGEIA